MFHYFLVPLADRVGVFNVFRYITFRAGGAMVTALLIVFAIGPPMIRWLRERQGNGQPIRTDGPQRHIVEKQGTPTMGGLMILVSSVAATLLWTDLTDAYVWIVLIATLSFGLLGFADDHQKVTRRTSAGVSSSLRLFIEIAVAVAASYAVMRLEESRLSGVVTIPFFKTVVVPLGWGYLAFGALVVVGASNAVNLTDGLDGLAIVPVIIAALTFALIAYLVGNIKFADYLQLNYVAGTGELAVFLSALVGGGLGFLWYNAHPAEVFMGDVGSLALGGAIGTVALIIRQELLLPFIGGIFILEAVSVVLQVGSYKLRKKRIFKMAPLHHHFEQLGWSESKVIVRFWIGALVFALFALTTLKLR